MQVPAWLDVALEGGALELQRALVRYRSLRRALAGDWRTRASDVAELCQSLGRCETDVEGALAKALRRARHDPNAGAGTHLAIAVERERRRTGTVLAEVCGGEASLAELIAHLEDVARDECHLETAWRRFHVERAAWTAVLLGTVLALPFGSWWSASFGGDVPVLFSLDGLRELPVVPVLFGAGLVVMVGWLRLATWSWLGLKTPWLSAAAGGAIALATSFAGAIAVVADALPIVSVSLGVLAVMALATLQRIWLVPKKPLLAPL